MIVGLTGLRTVAEGPGRIPDEKERLAFVGDGRMECSESNSMPRSGTAIAFQVDDIDGQ